MKDSRERFSATVENYEKYRPSYPAELIDWIVATAGLPPKGTIADIGCGTGISTRLFGERGFDVVGIDPNEDMLASARKAGGRYQKGECSATGLPDRAFDLATAAQAFHWFDVPKTMIELKRILKPTGWAAAFWNMRAKASPFQDEYSALLDRHSTEYKEVGMGQEVIERIKGAAGVVSPREKEFANRQVLDREGFFGRAYSSSYVAHGISDYPAFDADMNALFDKHRQDGRVTFLYRAVVVAWRFDSI